MFDLFFEQPGHESTTEPKVNEVLFVCSVDIAKYDSPYFSREMRSHDVVVSAVFSFFPEPWDMYGKWKLRGCPFLQAATHIQPHASRNASPRQG